MILDSKKMTIFFNQHTCLLVCIISIQLLFLLFIRFSLYRYTNIITILQLLSLCISYWVSCLVPLLAYSCVWKVQLWIPLTFLTGISFLLPIIAFLNMSLIFILCIIQPNLTNNSLLSYVNFHTLNQSNLYYPFTVPLKPSSPSPPLD